MRSILLLAIALSTVLVSAQSTKSVSLTPEANSQAFLKAFEFRKALVVQIVQGSKTPAEALTLLQAEKLPAGVDFDAGAGLAIAATDIGNGLLANGKPTEAEFFFKKAEQAFGESIEKTKDASSKASLLEQRAFIRANFLNKTPDADQDLAAAILLRPDDKLLQRKRDQLPATKSARKDGQVKS